MHGGDVHSSPLPHATHACAAQSSSDPLSPVSSPRRTPYPAGHPVSTSTLPFLTLVDPATLATTLSVPKHSSPAGHAWHASSFGFRMRLNCKLF